MYIISVLPIAKSLNRESLTYFNRDTIDIGSIVSVTLRKKSIFAIVLSSEKAVNIKSELKKMPFAVKRVQKKNGPSFFSTAFIKTVGDLSLFFAASQGQVIASLINSSLLKQIFSHSRQSAELVHSGSKFEELAIQAEESERVDIYKGLIRESFAKKESIFICLPSEHRARKLFDILSKNIEEYTILFSANIGSKKLKNSISVNESEKHPLLIIGTTAYLSVARHDLKMIIVEDESSRFYKHKEKPYIDARVALRMFASNKGIKIFYADTLLRIETLYRISRKEINEYYRIMARRRTSLDTLIVDMRSKLAEKQSFEVLSNELKEMIVYAERNKKNVFLFALRRGLSPQTVCRDCGSTVLCARCGAPVVVHRIQNDSGFICHHCGTRRTAEETCTNCKSWRLEMLGVGIDRVSDELKKIYFGRVYKIDSDSCRTYSDVSKIIAGFTKTGGIILGTEMALNYLDAALFDYSAITSFDSLFSIPDFRINERIMHTILQTKSLARENFLLQSRNTDHPIIEMGVSGDLSSFAQYEIAYRNKFQYPPFKTFIKISVVGDSVGIDSRIKELLPLLSEYDPLVFPAFIKTLNNKIIKHILIRLNVSDWPDDKLRATLMSFPPFISVKVDPESLL